MTRKSVAVSLAAKDALGVLGNQIELGRHARGWTAEDLANRLGVDRRTVRSLEAGMPTVSIGVVFDAACLVGVDLFGMSGPELARARQMGRETLALLPAKVHRPKMKEGADDFAF